VDSAAIIAACKRVGVAEVLPVPCSAVAGNAELFGGFSPPQPANTRQLINRTNRRTVRSLNVTSVLP
jgi:hypothetical protein